MIQLNKERCRMISLFGDVERALKQGPNRLFDGFQPPRLASVERFVRLDGGDNSENSVHSCIKAIFIAL